MEQDMMRQFAEMLAENNKALFSHIEKENDKLRAEFRQENEKLRAELKADNAALRAEMRTENDTLRVELGEHVRHECGQMKNEILAYVENTVVKRIDSLFDGYVTVRERQDALQKEVDDMRIRLEKLEMIVQGLAS